MRKKNKCFAIYRLRRVSELVPDQFFEDQALAEEKAKALAAQFHLSHLVVDYEYQTQVARFDPEQAAEITHVPHPGIAVSLADAIAASRQAQAQERAKKKERDSRYSKARVARLSANRKRKLCPSHEANLEAQACDSGFKGCQFKRAQKAKDAFLFVDKTSETCDDTASKM